MLAFASVGSPVRADVELPSIFGDHMVLQRGRSVPVWGLAKAGESVTVEFAGSAKTTTAAKDGRWSVSLDALAAGGPEKLVVRGSNTLTFEDVLVGEVWLGSGQSNMHMSVDACNDFAAEAARAKDSKLRMFREDSMPSPSAQWKGIGEWVVCTPETVGKFSGTLYFFGRELRARLGVPIGLIDSSLGGTPIESWISPEAQFASPDVAELASKQEAEYWKFDVDKYLDEYWKTYNLWLEDVERAKAKHAEIPDRPRNAGEYHLRVGSIGHLFNAKIAPLIPFAIRGVVWYQGEENTVHASRYRHQLPLLVDDWRKRWGEGDFPFVWVQLPNFLEGRPGYDWPTMREVMRRALCIENSGMAITIDIGDPHDIHPADKQDVGKRVAAWALGTVYGFAVPTSGPLFEMLVQNEREMIAIFSHVDGGLVAKGGELTGFEVLGGDGEWHAASARIDRNRVIVDLAKIAKPSALRYAWANDPKCNLFNGAGFPASPFTSVEGSK